MSCSKDITRFRSPVTCDIIQHEITGRLGTAGLRRPRCRWGLAGGFYACCCVSSCYDSRFFFLLAANAVRRTYHHDPAPSAAAWTPDPDTHDTCGYLRVYISMYFCTRTSDLSMYLGTYYSRHSHFCTCTRVFCFRIVSVFAQA